MTDSPRDRFAYAIDEAALRQLEVSIREHAYLPPADDAEATAAVYALATEAEWLVRQNERQRRDLRFASAFGWLMVAAAAGALMFGYWVGNRDATKFDESAPASIGDWVGLAIGGALVAGLAALVAAALAFLRMRFAERLPR